jgi:hypothetical protein
VLEIALRYWYDERERERERESEREREKMRQHNSEVTGQGKIYFCRRVCNGQKEVWEASTLGRKSAQVLSRTQFCPLPGLGRFQVHSLHGWLIGKGKGQGKGLWREVQKFR